MAPQQPRNAVTLEANPTAIRTSGTTGTWNITFAEIIQKYL